MSVIEVKEIQNTIEVMGVHNRIEVKLSGIQGPKGDVGESGYSVGNLDGGFPDSTYGGVYAINAGGVSE